jgi:O-6-methylguanine DNA methyltransferase
MILRSHIHHPLVDLTLFLSLDKNGNPVLKGIVFGIFQEWKGEKAAEAGSEYSLERLRRDFTMFLDGSNKALDQIQIDLRMYSSFKRHILKTARSIEWGRVVSYSDLARMSGFPKAVRAVASVMRNNDFPLVIPCHRVIRKNGSIGGFMGETRGKCVELKKLLLERETI